MKLGPVVDLFKTTFRQWHKDRAVRLGASLAFFTILSLLPLFVLVSVVVARVLGKHEAIAHLIENLKQTFGKPLGDVFAGMLEESRNPFAGDLATTVGALALVFGAFQTFGELEESLNDVFHVRVKSTPTWWGKVRRRFLSVQMVVGVVLFLFVGLLGPLALNVLSAWLTDVLWGGPVFWEVTHNLFVFLLMLLLFGLIFKIMPDVVLAWRDVWVGAALTALLFLGGKFLLTTYLRSTGISSGFGLPRSLLVILLWIYYTCEILLLGAEFTKAYADRCGNGVRPADYAVRRKK